MRSGRKGYAHPMKPHRYVAPLILLSAAGLALAALVPHGGPVGNKAVPQPAKAVDLDRYIGLWYEIARYDNSFERGCEAARAEYRKRDDGLIDVINTCRKGGTEGRLISGIGRAKVVPGSDNTQLKVSFFGPFFFGNYWVLDHADDYAWSIVGEPSGRYLWLLCRTPAPSPKMRAAIIDRTRALGYDVSLIRTTLH